MVSNDVRIHRNEKVEIMLKCFSPPSKQIMLMFFYTIILFTLVCLLFSLLVWIFQKPYLVTQSQFSNWLLRTLWHILVLKQTYFFIFLHAFKSWQIILRQQNAHNILGLFCYFFSFIFVLYVLYKKVHSENQRNLRRSYIVKSDKSDFTFKETRELPSKVDEWLKLLRLSNLNVVVSFTWLFWSNRFLTFF